MKQISYPDLRKRTTLRIGGKAILEIVVEDIKEFDLLPSILEKKEGVPFIIGKGSNILADDGIVPVVLIRLDMDRVVKVIKEDKERVVLEVNASLPLSTLIRFCIRHGLSGVEGLSGIPGTVGGAVAMNAGSFGVEMKDVVRKVTIWAEDKGLLDLSRDELRFGYREFLPKVDSNFWCVVKAELSLKKDFPLRVKERAREFYLKKKSLQPILTHTCGCVFKNPSSDMPAGYLLEKCGMKGYRIGDMAFSEKHANFLVNLGQGRSEDAWKLIEIARSKVKKLTGVHLEMEVKTIQKEKIHFE